MNPENIYHVLNGDCLLDPFMQLKFPGEYIIIREAFIEGPLQPDLNEHFWNQRASYIQLRYDETKKSYQNKVLPEFEKLQRITASSTVNLWFDYDLFCHINCWAVIHFLQPVSRHVKCYIVYPAIHKDDLWSGFGKSTREDLLRAYSDRILLKQKDIELAEKLWIAVASHNLNQLAELSETPSKAFPHLKEVCTAHIERFPQTGNKGRPERVIEEIIKKNCNADFLKVFSEFSQREGVYGFGDLQFKELFDKVAKVL